MKAMLLAAGRGERMRPLTDAVPKSLLQVGNKPLIVHHIEALRQAGIGDLVINLGYLGERISQVLGDGHRHGVRIAYSREPEDALETGGGIFQALCLLGSDPFAVINSDIWTDYDFAGLPVLPRGLAHLVLVDNPVQHPRGDFALDGNRVLTDGPQRLTFSGISVLRPELFRGCRPGRFPLSPLLRRAITEDRVSGEYYPGAWRDIGTPERLDQLHSELKILRTERSDNVPENAR